MRIFAPQGLVSTVKAFRHQKSWQRYQVSQKVRRTNRSYNNILSKRATLYANYVILYFLV